MSNKGTSERKVNFRSQGPKVKKSAKSVVSPEQEVSEPPETGLATTAPPPEEENLPSATGKPSSEALAKKTSRTKQSSTNLAKGTSRIGIKKAASGPSVSDVKKTISAVKKQVEDIQASKAAPAPSPGLTRSKSSGGASLGPSTKKKRRVKKPAEDVEAGEEAPPEKTKKPFLTRMLNKAKKTVIGKKRESKSNTGTSGTGYSAESNNADDTTGDKPKTQPKTKRIIGDEDELRRSFETDDDEDNNWYGTDNRKLAISILVSILLIVGIVVGVVIALSSKGKPKPTFSTTTGTTPLVTYSTLPSTQCFPPNIGNAAEAGRWCQTCHPRSCQFCCDWFYNEPDRNTDMVKLGECTTNCRK